MASPEDQGAILSRRPRRWDLVLLALGAMTVTVSILFWAWLVVWFQLFGEQPDRSDYLEASGLYAGGLVWLVVAGGFAWLAGAPLWLKWWCGLGSALFGLLWLNARSEAADREPPTAGWDHQGFADGFETALLQMPWAWLVVVAAVMAVLFRVTGRSQPGSVTREVPDGT